MKKQDIYSSLVRKPVFAGSFYPSSKNSLLAQLKGYFEQARVSVSESQPQALIAPHAGYVYSGQVAASVYNQLLENPAVKRVFILASSHHSHFQGASVCNVHEYETPLGRVKVDEEVTGRLLHGNSLFRYLKEAHRYEHSLEVQLPFLQYKLGDAFRLVPVVLGTHYAEECREIAQLLEPWFNHESLFVISTDFSHYPAYDDAVENDFNTAQAICGNNPEELLGTLSRKNNIPNLATSLCGWTSVLTLLYLTQNKNMKYRQVQYRNSGDAPVYGERDRVVGYWAIAVYNEEMQLRISPQLQKEMLESARRAIILHLMTGQPFKPLSSFDLGKDAGGMFVSIYVKGKLRGCVGNIDEGNLLYGTLEHLAVAACCDNRFDSVRTEEFDDMELEISVLSHLHKISSIDEILPGTHGVYIKKNNKTGTFLPRVAEKTGWTVEELLGHCARDKAGLEWDDWKNAEIYTYEAFVFRG